jgi:hypothetical protein
LRAYAVRRMHKHRYDHPWDRRLYERVIGVGLDRTFVP